MTIEITKEINEVIIDISEYINECKLLNNNRKFDDINDRERRIKVDVIHSVIDKMSDDIIENYDIYVKFSYIVNINTYYLLPLSNGFLEGKSPLPGTSVYIHKDHKLKDNEIKLIKKIYNNMKTNYKINKITLNDLDVNNSIDISRFINYISDRSKLTYYFYIDYYYNNLNDLYNNYIFEILDDELLCKYKFDILSVIMDENKFIECHIKFEEKL